VTKTPATVPVVVGGLAKAPSTAVLNDCKSSSEVPSNINDVFIVPVGTTSSSAGSVPNAGAGDYDCYQPLITTTNGASLLKFYKSQLEARGWSLFSQGSSSGKPQSLFQKAGNDGFYWVAVSRSRSPRANCALDIPDLSKLRNGLSQFLFGRDGFRARQDQSAKLSG